MITHEEILETELSSSISVIKNEMSNSSNLEKISNLLSSINTLLEFCLKELLKNGKIKVGIFEIPKVWKAAKNFVEEILLIWPQDQLMRKLEAMPLSIGDTLITYIIWCFQNIIKDNKVKIGILDIIPFIVRTIKMIKEITKIFKSKGLFNPM